MPARIAFGTALTASAVLWAALAAIRLTAGASADLLVFPAAALLGWATVLVGLRLHRPGRPRVWYLLQGAMSALLMGAATYASVPAGAAPRSLALPGALFLLGAVALLAGVAWISHALRVRVDEAHLLDALILLVAFGTMLWELVIGPLLTGGYLGDLVRVLRLAHPVLNALVLALVVHIFLVNPRRPPALWGVAAAAAAGVAPALALAVLVGNNLPWHPPDLDLGWFAAAALLALAALHPSMRAVTEPGNVFPYSLGRGRSLALAAALLACPVAVVLSTQAFHRPFQPAQLLVPSALVTTVVLVRLRRLFLEKERSECEMAVREHRFRRLVEHQSDHVLVVGRDGAVSYQSPSLTRILGYAPDALVGRPALRLFPGADQAAWAGMVERGLSEPGTAIHGRLRALTAQREVRAFEVTLTGLAEAPAVDGAVVVLHDVTERARFEEQLRRQALHDPLTGLANRALILDRAEHMLASARRSRLPVGALFIDLDNFKKINDSLGHEAGDRLLVSVADRLRRAVRGGDTVGRMGGDEFIVLFAPDPAAGSPERVAERICEVLRPPVALSGRAYPVGASIGIAVATAGTADDLLRDADIAMYRAKAGGRNRFVVFRPEMRVAAGERLQMELDLRAALADGDLAMLYQPAIELTDLTVTGVEALLRWNHPERGVLSPASFLPLAEESGFIEDIGRWVLDTVCRTAAAWEGPAGRLPVSVNISARQLDAERLVHDVATALADSGLPPARLVLEIPEGAIMGDPEAAAGRLRRLKALGVRVAVDDFGAGYSSLNYLRRLPVDVLKIDMSFIASMRASRTAAAVVRLLVQLGKAHGLEVVAEGVEAEGQLAALRREHCDAAQGYVFTGPVDAAGLARFLAEHSLGRAGSAGPAVP